MIVKKDLSCIIFFDIPKDKAVRGCHCLFVFSVNAFLILHIFNLYCLLCLHFVVFNILCSVVFTAN